MNDGETPQTHTLGDRLRKEVGFASQLRRGLLALKGCSCAWEGTRL